MSELTPISFQAHTNTEKPDPASVIQEYQSCPLVSVLLPVFNCEKYITSAIESILSQTYRPLEIIIVNDGSTDTTSERLSAFGSKIHVIEQPNQGMSSALNNGLAHAAGKYIAFLDADDLWSPQKLRVQVDYLETHSNVSMVFSNLQQFISPELDEQAKQSLICPEIPEPGYVKITMLCRRQVFEQAGSFNTAFKVGDFVDWYMRAKEAGLEDHLLPDVLAMRRLHKSHSTAHTYEAMKGFVHVLKAGLDRRRAASDIKPASEGKLKR
jgi:glycosyltransferase involved in cell wall biosynthesis